MFVVGSDEILNAGPVLLADHMKFLSAYFKSVEVVRYARPVGHVLQVSLTYYTRRGA